jgi:hypothetical protein
MALAYNTRRFPPLRQPPISPARDAPGAPTPANRRHTVPMRERQDVILGAGLAGLTAAYTLQEGGERH